MRIENCIEDFVISVYTQKPPLFCSLLCYLDLTKLRKEIINLDTDKIQASV